MVSPRLLPNSAGKTLDSAQFWRENAGGRWATAVVLLLIVAWKLFAEFSWRQGLRSRDSSWSSNTSPSLNPSPSTGVSRIITDEDLRELRIMDICFQMKEWDKTLIKHKQLQVDETSGTEIGCMIKKFPFLTPREYILTWLCGKGKTEPSIALSSNVSILWHPDRKNMLELDFSYLAGMSGKVFPVTEIGAGTDGEVLSDMPTSSTTLSRQVTSSMASGRSQWKKKKPSKKQLIANGLLLVGRIACLSRGRTTLVTQLSHGMHSEEA